MPTERYDVVVLGVGGMGSAALYALAKHGVKACGVEQFGLGHDRGSSHGQTRIIRRAYFEHPDYVPLLDRAYELWAELQAETGVPLHVTTGLLLALKRGGTTVENLVACYARGGHPHERWSPHQSRQRFPQFNLSEDLEVFYDPQGGFLYVETCVRQMVAAAQARGAVLHTHERVISWQADKHGVVVTTEKRRLQARRLVLTAGAWTGAELASLSLDLRVWRRVVLWYQFPEPEAFRAPGFPVFYVETDYGHFYGFPILDDLGLKVAEHVRPQVIPEPNRVNRELAPNDEAPILRFLRETFGQAHPRRTRHDVCLYTMTPDEHFILDLHPQHRNVVIAAGFSGHGYKFAPVIGEIVSELATEGRSRHPIDFLRLGRLRDTTTKTNG